MGLGEVQNINARTLETQAVFQQSISASELALRQAEKNLAAERSRRESMVEDGSEASGGDGAALDLNKRVNAEKQRQYRLAYNGQAGPMLEIEPNFAQVRPRRLDLNA